MIPVDAFGGREAVQSNIAPMKACMRWLKQGGVLGVFPSGTVSHLKVRDERISDPPWHPNVAALVRRTGATVVPVFFEGRNSMMFQLAGLVHPGLRTALLPNELLKRSHSQLTVFVGRPIGPDKVGALRGRPDADRLPALEDVHAAAPDQPHPAALRAPPQGPPPPPSRSRWWPPSRQPSW